jgi:hypothetical protein
VTVISKEIAKEESGGQSCTYEPKEDDEIDKKFAEIYNNSEYGGNAYPVKKLDDDPDVSN